MPLPTVTDEYNNETGALEKQCTNEGKPCTEGKPKTITNKYNTLGQLVEYTDADEAVTTYEYYVDGSAKKINDGKGVETYTYSSTTGLPTELLNEYGTTKLPFTATYDTEGNMLTEGYPNGMTATYTYNQVGKPTALVYKKTSNCIEEEKEKCKWFKDAIVPSIHGQWLEQTSTLSHQAYTYDVAGRLTQVQNTPAGGKCTTRIYEYDADANRTDLKTYEPGAEGKCAAEKGVEEKHTYDTADRLTDTGTAYNTFADITALPAADAGGKEASEGLTSEYYVDNQLASQIQGEQTIGYHLDPAGRTIETVATGKRNETITDHYAGPGDTPAWTSNTTGEATREIAGITGTLTATQSNLAEPVLQLTNLHGDIVATASLTETATELTSKVDTSEFGVPTTSLPPKYSWLGADDIPTELPSGVLSMGARSYVPEIGRFLQPDPVTGGSANAYTYAFGDPVNTSDPSGQYATGIDSEIGGAINAEADREGSRRAAIIAAEEAVRRAFQEAAARWEAESAAWQAREAAEAAAGPQYGGEEWGEEEWGEEEWGEEEVSLHPGEGKQTSPLVEEGLFFQPESVVESSGTGSEGVVVCIEHSKAASHPCMTSASASALAHMCIVDHNQSACARYVSFFGNLVRGAENLAKGAARGVVKAAKHIVHWLKSHAAEVKTVGCLVQGIGVGTLVGAGATALSDGIGVYAAGTIGGTAGAAVTYACEHEQF